MSLPTPVEVIERWPLDDYTADTLGGQRRDLILEAWRIADRLPIILRSTWLAAVEEHHDHLDDIQERALAAVLQAQGFEASDIEAML